MDTQSRIGAATVGPATAAASDGLSAEARVAGLASGALDAAGAYEHIRAAVGVDLGDPIVEAPHVSGGIKFPLERSSCHGTTYDGRHFVHIQGLGTLRQSYSDTPGWVVEDDGGARLGTMVLIGDDGVPDSEGLRALGRITRGEHVEQSRVRRADERARIGMINAILGPCLRFWDELPDYPEGLTTGSHTKSELGAYAWAPIMRKAGAFYLFEHYIATDVVILRIAPDEANSAFFYWEIDSARSDDSMTDENGVLRDELALHLRSMIRGDFKSLAFPSPPPPVVPHPGAGEPTTDPIAARDLIMRSFASGTEFQELHELPDEKFRCGGFRLPLDHRSCFGRLPDERHFVHVQGLGTLRQAFSDNCAWVVEDLGGDRLGTMVLIDTDGNRLWNEPQPTAQHGIRHTELRAWITIANALTGPTLQAWEDLPEAPFEAKDTEGISAELALGPIMKKGREGAYLTAASAHRGDDRHEVSGLHPGNGATWEAFKGGIPVDPPLTFANGSPFLVDEDRQTLRLMPPLPIVMVHALATQGERNYLGEWSPHS